MSDAPMPHPAPPRQRLGAMALADLPGLTTRHPAQFRAMPPGRLAGLIATAAALGLLVFALWRLEFSPARLLGGIGALGRFLVLMLPPDPGSWTRAGLILHGLAETVAIAFLGTLMAAILALPLALLGARNTTVNRLVQFLARRFLDGVRGIDALIWALIWISVVGLGPFAGVLAIMTSDVGTFGKMFSEAIEATDRRAAEGITAAGGSRLQRIRFGVLPEVLPVLAGQALYLFESNTRSSTIIGIVGAGGIGLYLSEMIRTLEWQSVSFIILLILMTVALIDFLSSKLRAAIASGG
ncbi:phosphonate ABC transporter, permease protein PhnE [Roseomonas sp. NAR14]|uniref:Phosphonate ABC transporter, permease protein PhnE n=1 Tax=Roseomonas acroporae TaxID=2937791 RepID=A0A9X2BVZ9_9PROT|nr:phosphonate ABC transporter, permease protein PhnE [Roseomonas acroporae]MCK8787197.1 phosphonate ABC transporter, permease protein PhnE [Roseomonas acroporae]